jgi:hypothetical protein
MTNMVTASLHAMQHLVENRVDDLLEKQLEVGWEPRDEDEIKCLIGGIREARAFIERVVQDMIDGPLKHILPPGLDPTTALMSGQIQFVPVHPDPMDEWVQKSGAMKISADAFDPKKVN